MGKLHELLAVEKDVKNVMAKIVTETAKTFKDRSAHFCETRKAYEPINEADTDRPDEEFSPMVTSVVDKLAYTESHLVRAIDVFLQKEKSNQTAKADWDVELPDGSKKTILKDVPVTMLVQLESILADLRSNIYDAIPTLDPAKVWTKDVNRKNVFVADSLKRARSKKVQKPIVLYQATDKHPAQTQLITEDETVGYWIHSTSSSALAPIQKSELIDRLDRLISGVKIARAKANDIECDKSQVGKNLFRFINEGIIN